MIDDNDLRQQGQILDPLDGTIPVSAEVGSVSSVGSVGGWGPCKPLDEPDELPGFPVFALGGKWAEYVDALARSTQTPPEMAAVTLLGVLATCLHGRYRVRGKRDHYEPLALWPVVVAEPGSRKSSVLKAQLEPVHRWQREEAKRVEPVRADALARREALEAELSRVRKRSVKADATEADRAEVDRLTAEIAQVPVPFPSPRIVGADATPEAVAVLLAEQGRFTLASAEGDEVFAIAAGRYSEGSNLDVFLKGHAGDSHSVHRIGRPSLFIPEATLSLVLMVQPSVLRARSTAETRGRGFLGRILYSIPPNWLGEREYAAAPEMPEALSEWYRDAVSALLSLPVQRTEDGWDTKLIDLSPGAYKAYDAYFRELEPELADGGRFEFMRDWAGKLHGTVLRIAALLHAAQDPHLDPATRPIPYITMSNAILVSYYFMAHAEAAFATMGGNESVEESRARRVLEWIRRRRGTDRTDTTDRTVGPLTFTERDVARAFESIFQGKVDMIRPVLEVLADHGYVQPAPENGKANPKRGGRPGSPRWYVNPAVWS